jgi:hypothetical protein
MKERGASPDTVEFGFTLNISKLENHYGSMEEPLSLLRDFRRAIGRQHIIASPQHFCAIASRTATQL